MKDESPERHRRLPARKKPFIPREKSNPSPSIANQNKPEEVDEFEQNTARLAAFMAQRYVRRDGKFYRIDDPRASFSASDVKRTVVKQIRAAFPNIGITDKLWSAVCKRAIEDTHTDETQSIAVWDGKQACCPSEPDRLIQVDGMASLNTWSRPPYRGLGIREAEFGLFDELLERIFPQAADRVVFKDWLSWNLQNEGDKPTWTILLYSQSKGTGKSTLAGVLSRLFGEANAMTLNGVSKLVARFNKTVLVKKFIICEEVKLKPGTDTGNTVKALISEKEVAVEGKGTNAEALENVCTYLMTTNHYPHWIEPDDRRFYVIDVNHEGHASGVEADAFQAFMKVFYDYMDDPESIARLYNALMEHRQSNSFNPYALNVAAADTLIMKQLCADSGQVLQQVLQEMLSEQGRYAMPLGDLVKLFKESLKVNPARIAHMMRDFGWRREKCKWGGAEYSRVIWVHPDYQIVNGRVTGSDGYDQPVSTIEEEMDAL